MNWKFTLTLLAIVGALYLFFTYVESKQPNQPEPTLVFAVDRNQVDALSLTDHDQKIDLARAANDNTKWTVKAPVADRADQSLIDQIMTNLEILRWTDKIPAKDVKGKLGDFGLQTPRARLVVTAHGGRNTELLFGNDTVISGKTYLQLAGGDSIYVVSDELKKLLGKDVNSWRDHKLTDTLATDVNRLVIKNAAGEIELQKDGEHWRLVKPLAARADDTKVQETVSQLTNLQVASFVADDKADAASYGLAEPKGTITLYTANDPKGTELLIGNNPPDKSGPSSPEKSVAEEKFPQTVYVRMPSRQSIYTVSNAISSNLGLKPADLRDHSLARFNLDTVDRIHVTPEAGAAFTLGRKEKAWTILDGLAANQPADTGLVEKLINALTGPNVSDFVADSASDLAKYGLDKPLLQVKLSAYASENTAESNAGEKPIAAVSFGKGDESSVYARVSDEPFVVAVPKAFIDQFPSDAALWQALTIFKAEAAKVTSLEVTVKGRPALTLNHPDKGTWTPTNKIEGALDNAKTESIINTLSRLRAVRWEGAVKPEFGLVEPAATLKFGSPADAKLGGRLVLGGFAKDGGVYAQADGKPGVFVVSRPDYTVLTDALIPGAPPAPTPVPPPASATPPEGGDTVPGNHPVPAATPTTATPASSPALTSLPVPATPAPTAAPATPAPTPVATPEATPMPTAAPATPVPMPESTPMPTAPPPTPEPTPAATPMITVEPAAPPAATPLPEAASPAITAPPTPKPETSPIATPAGMTTTEPTPTE